MSNFLSSKRADLTYQTKISTITSIASPKSQGASWCIDQRQTCHTSSIICSAKCGGRAPHLAVIHPEKSITDLSSSSIASENPIDSSRLRLRDVSHRLSVKRNPSEFGSALKRRRLSKGSETQHSTIPLTHKEIPIPLENFSANDPPLSLFNVATVDSQNMKPTFPPLVNHLESRQSVSDDDGSNVPSKNLFSEQKPILTTMRSSKANLTLPSEPESP